MNHIELFAGCGGLSIGLESAGFELLVANELSPMAAESFAFNILGEDLTQYGKDRFSDKVHWLSSAHDSIQSRLRENPFAYPEVGQGYSELPTTADDLKGKLLVGNIIHLNQILNSNEPISEVLKDGFGGKEVDLVSGGPPCQSFSMAGLRNKDCDKNSLPWEFANTVEHIKPKFVLLENVTGILRAFQEDGKKYYAWFEVAKVFAEKGYLPLCLHVNARLAGVPQNRPRFIMLGIRNDVFNQIQNTFNETEQRLFESAQNLYSKIQRGKNVTVDDLEYFDAQKDAQLHLFSQSFLNELIGNNEVSVKDAIDDLKFSSSPKKSAYVKHINKELSLGRKSIRKQVNHEPRQNSPKVKRRFRLYQILKDSPSGVSNEVTKFLQHKINVLSEDVWNHLRTYAFLMEDGDLDVFTSKNTFEQYLNSLATKKQTQRALSANTPAPATLSIPDDACHYDVDELRTLTVREMARIQSFPDNFEFRSKVTTGGQMRRFEVPQYTQVGNAVPPLLGLRLGKVIGDLINRTK